MRASFYVLINHLYVSLEKHLFRYSAYFLIGLFTFLWLSCMSCFCILEIKHLPVTSFVSIFSQSVCCLFILLVFSYAMQKFVSLNRYHFAFIYIVLGDWLKKSLVRFMSKTVCKCVFVGVL